MNEKLKEAILEDLAKRMAEKIARHLNLQEVIKRKLEEEWEEIEECMRWGDGFILYHLELDSSIRVRETVEKVGIDE